MKHLKTIFLIISLLAVNQLSAQDDLGSSLSVDITKKIIPRLNLSLEEDFRLRDNLSEVDRFLDYARIKLQTLEVPGNWRSLQPDQLQS